MTNQTLKQKAQQIKAGKLSAVQNTMDFGEKISQLNPKLNIFLHKNEQAIEQAKEIDNRIKNKKPTGKLAGLCFGIKSNISVKELTINCGSKVLENYVSGYDASVIEKLKNQDAIILGMLNMDEFASGSSGETSAFGPTKNPINPELIPGGSSSGPAAAISAGLCDFTIGSDTGGSIRNPASHCNITGLKPSYGVVSRYGLLDLTMSTDTIGPLTNSVEDAELIFNIIKGQDNFDATTKELEKQKTISKNLTIGLVNVKDFCNKEIANTIEQKAQEIAKKHSWKIKSINLPLDIVIQTYYILTYVEFFSATRKFDGRRFGFKIEEKAGPEVIRRILGGSEISKAEYHGKYYRNALKAKEFVKKQFDKIFEQVDFIIMPTLPKPPHKIGQTISLKDMYDYDVFTIPASIAGLPAISIPVGMIQDKPSGLQIIAPKFQDNFLLDIAKRFE